MSIRVTTDDSVALLAAINKAIDEGHLVEWSVDEDSDYQHTDDEWKHYGWMRPAVESKSQLILSVIAPEDGNMSSFEYAILHSQFVLMLLSDFDDMFDEATVTADIDDDDSI